jgi:hypothetical protein
MGQKCEWETTAAVQSHRARYCGHMSFVPTFLKALEPGSIRSWEGSWDLGDHKDTNSRQAIAGPVPEAPS